MKPIHIAAAVALTSTATAALLGLMLVPVVVLAGSQHRTDSSPSAIALEQIPAELLARYITAGQTCQRLPWQVIAAIGFVESGHGTFGGATVDPTTGDVRPPIIGPAINGGPRLASIADPTAPDGWAHARGPMQFLPSTWATWAVLGDGRPFDATPDVDNAWDAIATAGEYLCAGRDEITDLDAAIRRYNNSDTYLNDVLDKATEYGLGHDGTDAEGDNLETLPGDVRRVVAFALAQLGRQYVWGAEGPDAFDCSGLTLAAYRTIGIRLPHYSSAQARYGISIDPDTDGIEAGDLIFTRGGSPVHDLGHVGIALDADRYIVAPHTGDVIQIKLIPDERVQAVRRLVTTTPDTLYSPDEPVPDPYPDVDTSAADGPDLRWAPAVVTERINRSAAVILAAVYDRITANPTTLAAHVTAMKRTNPKLRLLAWSDVGPINPEDPAVAVTVTDACRHAIDASGYDGCLLNITLTPDSPCPVEPSTTTTTTTTTIAEPASSDTTSPQPPVDASCSPPRNDAAVLEAIRGSVAQQPDTDGELLVLVNDPTGHSPWVQP